METTRRNFVKSAALLAAGAGIGLPLAGGAPKRVRTELRMIIFNEPIVVKGMIRADEQSDLFVLETGTFEARLPLSTVRRVLDGRRLPFEAVIETPEETRSLPARAYVQGNRFCMEEDKPSTDPCWISLKDVRKAVGPTA